MTNIYGSSLTRRQILAGAAATASAQFLLPHSLYAAPVGTATLTTVSDGNLSLPAGFSTDGMPPEIDPVLAKHGLSRDMPFTPECNLTLWQDGKNTVIFDAGAGPDFMPSTGILLDSLDAAGIAPDDVTHVVFTHAHPDHLWGVIDDFDDPMFFNARHMMGRVERDYWLNPNTVDTIGVERQAFVAGALRRLELLGDRIEVFEAETEILPGIYAQASGGHTPGHMAFELRSGSETALVLGDAIGNHHMSFANPLWELNSDQDKAEAAKTRAKLFDRITAEQMAIVGFHLPNGGFGRVETASDGGYQFVQS